MFTTSVKVPVLSQTEKRNVFVCNFGCSPRLWSYCNTHNVDLWPMTRRIGSIRVSDEKVKVNWAMVGSRWLQFLWEFGKVCIWGDRGIL